MDGFRSPKRFVFAERPDSWRCSHNTPKKQSEGNQVTANVFTHLPRHPYHDPLMMAASMTAERGAWRGCQ